MFFATHVDGDRKPLIGMWNLFIDKCCGGISPDLKESIYVGD
jgi:histidinol phosphatase-like enzyme